MAVEMGMNYALLMVIATPPKKIQSTLGQLQPLGGGRNYSFCQKCLHIVPELWP